jgi:hypothetical protein
MRLINAIRKFKRLEKTVKSIMLNIYIGENGPMLMQIFCVKHSIKCGWDISSKYKDGYIVTLDFNKNKINNNENYERFTKSQLFASFEKYEFIKRDSYFYHIHPSTKAKKIQLIIHQILIEVYDYQDKLFFT